MNTTTLLVDLVIIGTQVLIWLLLLFLGFTKSTAYVYAIVRDNQAVAILFFGFIGYSVGIMFDYIISWIFKILKFEKPDNLFAPAREPNVIDILANKPEVHKYLDSHYSRLRIAKATLFNIPLITVSVILWVAMSDLHPTIWLYIIILLIGTVLTIAARLAYKKRKLTYKNYLQRAFDLLTR